MRLFHVPTAAIVIIGLTVIPVFAETTATDNGATQVKNVQTGARNASAGWVEIFDGVATAQGQSKNTAEKFTGFISGAGIGARKALHRTSAGIIDLCTFWIPKKDPILSQNKKQ